MKEVIKELLGVGDKAFKVPILEYADIEEVNKHAGDNGLVVKKLNGYLHAHGTFSDARALIVDAVKELSGIGFITKDIGEKDAAGKPIMERDWDKDSDKKYVARVLTQKPDLFDRVQSLVTSRARGYKYKEADGKEVEVSALATNIRQRPLGIKGPKVLPAKYKEAAEVFIKTKLVGKPKNLKALNDWLAEKAIGPFAPVGELTTVENIVVLGWLIKAEKEATPAFSGAPV